MCHKVWSSQSRQVSCDVDEQWREGRWGDRVLVSNSDQEIELAVRGGLLENGYFWATAERKVTYLLFEDMVQME